MGLSACVPQHCYLRIESATTSGRLVGGCRVEEIKTGCDLKLGVVVGKGIVVEVVSAHELLQLLQLPHAR